MIFRRALVPVVAVILLLVAIPASAADSNEVAAVVAETGVYVEAGSSATEAEVSDYVAALRFEGEAVSMVVLATEPTGGATTFADAVYADLASPEGIVVVVAPETVGWSGTTTVYTDVEVSEALDASLDGTDDGEVLAIFTATLIGEPAAIGADDSAAVPVNEPASSSSGGGSSLLIWVLLIGGGLALFFWWRSRQNKTKGPRLDPRLADVKEAVQTQIDAVANDIIDMEDEVRIADNAQADEFYEAAGKTYNEVTDLYPKATTPQAMLDLANELDGAIWQLDSAEAVLDGKPLPPRPAPRTLPAPEPAQTPSRPSSSSGKGSGLPPRPDYSRRSSRRSSYSGPGLMEMLIAVGGAMMSGRRRSGGALLGPSRGRRVSTPQFPQVPQSRSSSPVPSPSRPATRSSSSSSRSSNRRGTTGRSRGGGRRRK